MMLAKVKLAKRIQTTVFDSELLDLISAAVADIRHAGVSFDYYPVQDLNGAVVDYIIEDSLIARAVVTYCVMNFGSPDDYDRLKASYDEQKGQLRESFGYGLRKLG